MMIKKRLIPALAVIVLLFAHNTMAEDRAGQYSTISVFFLYNSWEDEFAGLQDKWTESVWGTQIRHIVNPRLSVELWGTAASAGYTDPLDHKISFSSLNDTRLKGVYYLGDRVARAALSVNLPTGKKELSAEEYLVSLGIADNSRKFPVRRFGEGLNVGGELYWLPKTERVDLEVGGGYLYKGGYRLMKNSPADYKYGNEFFVKVTASTVSQPYGASGTVMFKTYAKDEFDGEPVFQSGDLIMLSGRLTYNRDLRGSVGFNVLLRGKGKSVGSELGSLVEEVLKSGRNDVLIFGGGSYPLSEQLRLLARGEYKHISANEFEIIATRYRPKADYFGFGGGVGYQFTLALSGSVVASYYSGSIDKVDLTGVGIATALTFRYW